MSPICMEGSLRFHIVPARRNMDKTCFKGGGVMTRVVQHTVKYIITYISTG